MRNKKYYFFVGTTAEFIKIAPIIKEFNKRGIKFKLITSGQNKILFEEFKEYLDELKKLNLPNDKYAVFGSGPLAIHKIRDSDDIDIIVKEDLWNKLIKKYPQENDKLIKIGSVEIYKNWLPWFKDVNFLIDDADIFENIRFVKLKYVLEWKKAYGREKDKRDVKLIEKYINTII